ncbi:hypothetical protein LCGC14_1166700 [marine sediment metagenome]|uniref:Uncharacterized protein n=1 Tax=marine sediment metagenome TaxID=412755 RepID=A0A0F9PWK2_9ZZZZ
MKVTIRSETEVVIELLSGRQFRIATPGLQEDYVLVSKESPDGETVPLEVSIYSNHGGKRLEFPVPARSVQCR